MTCLSFSFFFLFFFFLNYKMSASFRLCDHCPQKVELKEQTFVLLFLVKCKKSQFLLSNFI